MRSVPHDDRSAIDRAIDRAEQRAHDRMNIAIPVLRQPHAWPVEAEVSVVAPADPNEPVLMLFAPEEQAWRVIILPPGSTWRIQLEQAEPSPGSWWQRLWERLR